MQTLGNLTQDVRYSLRKLIRHRVFSLAAVLTFAIGLGATTSIFTLADAAWLSWSSSYRDSDRLVMLTKVFRTGAGLTSPFDCRDWRETMTSFEALACYQRSGARLTTAAEPAMVATVHASASFFSVLGVRPHLGRFFTPDEEQWGRNRVIVLSHRTWERDFARDPSIVGRKVILDDVPVEVIGVAPERTWFGGSAPALFTPLSFAPNDSRNSRNSHFIFSIARLKPAVSLEQSKSEAVAVAARIAAMHSGNLGTSINVEPLEDVVLGDVRPTLRLLLWAVLLVLVIACANVANLMLVRGAARYREMAVRSALGATSGRLTQQVLTESVILALAGGAIGLVFASGILRVVGGELPVELPRVAEQGLSIDWRVAAISLFAVLTCGIAAGMLPSLQLSRVTHRRGNADALREGSRGVAGGKGSTLARSSLVVAQVSLGMVLLVVSGLFARSLMRLQREDAGVREAQSVISVLLPLTRERTMDSAAHVRFFDDALRRLEGIPGVVSAGVASHLPLAGGGESKSFWVEGREPATNAEVASVVGRMESASSLQAVGAALIRGRWFAETDRAGAPNVAIISEGVAKKHFAGQDPIGQRIVLHRPEALTEPHRLPQSGRWPRWTVIGVVKDVKYASPRDEPENAVYVHYPQGLQVWTWGPRWLVARTHGDALALAAPMRRALRALDQTLPLESVMTLEERMGLSLKAPRFTAGLVMTFAVVAVLLAAIGLYGVIAYAVSQDTRSFGVRIALGATSSDVARSVLGRGTRLAALGIVLGLLGAAAATRWVESQLFGITALDPVTYAAGIAFLFTLALVASYVPARRAAAVDPLIALRSE